MSQDPILFLPGVILHSDARHDVVEIFSYLGRGSASNARRFLDCFEATTSHLVEFPNIGSPRALANPKLGGLRVWPVEEFKNYLIFYRAFASSNGVEILRVLHGSRDFETLFETD